MDVFWAFYESINIISEDYSYTVLQDFSHVHIADIISGLTAQKPCYQPVAEAPVISTTRLRRVHALTVYHKKHALFDCAAW